MALLVSVAIDPPSATIYDDSYVQFRAIGTYDDDTTQVLQPWALTWSSSDTDVATILNSYALYGRAYGVAPGAVTISAYVPASDLTVTAALTVDPHPAYVPANTRFALAFGTDTLNPYPTWTAIDAHPNLVTSYSIARGRSYELDQMNAGTATVEIIDPDGILDPTNPSGPYYGQIRPSLHAVLSRRNPVTGTWDERYRGFVDDFEYEVDPSQRVNRLKLSLVDLFDLAASAEMQPGQFGQTDKEGQVYYPGGGRPDQRIGRILHEIGLPRRMWVTLPGSVTLHSSTYSAGENALSAAQQAADAEFPGVAGLFCDRHGRLVFRPRGARFDPAGTAAAAGASRWDYHHWKAGDHAAIAASPADTAQVRTFAYTRGTSKIINYALALPVGAPDDAGKKSRVLNLQSIDTFGMRTWSASNLLTMGGELGSDRPTVSSEETARFSIYYIQNYAQPQDRINGITFRSLDPSDPRAAANWLLLSKVDIGDTIEVRVAAAGGGGFTGGTYFVEGIHEDVKPLTPDYDNVTMQLDLSPQTTLDPDEWWRTRPMEDWPSVKEDNPVMKPPGSRGSAGGAGGGSGGGGGGGGLPLVHALDHEFGGADPFRMHYENVGSDTGGGGGGIQFDMYNTGDWLYVEATGTGGSSWGIQLLTDVSDIDLYSGQDVKLVAARDVSITGRDFNLGTADRDVYISADRDVSLRANSGGTLDGHIYFVGLPTVDPLSSGALWVDAGGVLKVSGYS